jgi:hypothetical protein
MKTKLNPKESRWITVMSVVVTVMGCVVAFVLGAPDKYLAAIYCTVPTFAGMTEYFRNRWSSGRFWATLTSALLLHVALIWLVFAVALRERNDVGLLVCLPFIFIESFFLYHFVRIIGEEKFLRTDERK